MPARMIKKCALLLWAALALLLLAGCRVRTGLETGQSGGAGGVAVPGSPAASAENGAWENGAASGEIAGEGAPDGLTLENPAAVRKEYDETAAAEIVAAANRSIHQAGEGGGAALQDGETEIIASHLNDDAEETATQTVAAQEADKLGTAEDADMADSALTYFSVLLKERSESLYECKRLTVYWETPEDHVTVYKTSREHQMILDAGAYDVSARLLEQNLRVDDGWVQRKDPGVIVKAVDGDILGGGVQSASRAQAVYAGLLRREGWAGIDAVRHQRVLLISRELLEAPHTRLAVQLLIAKIANPDLYEDVDPARAFAMLTEEAAGAAAQGIYWYLPTDEERTP